MLREFVFKGRKRARRIIPAAAAAVIAVCGLGSCAALEMLDSLAAEEENAAQTTVAAPEAHPQETPVQETGAEDPAGNADLQQGGSDGKERPAETGADSGAAETAGADNIISNLGTILTGEDSSSGDTAAVLEQKPAQTPEQVIDQDQPVTPGELALTDLADSGNGSPDGGDIYTPGGYTPEPTDSDGGVFVPAQNEVPVYSAYSGLLDKYEVFTSRDPAYKAEFCHYYITDIEGNGVPEILIETGTIETDRTVYVYTFDGTDTVLLGNFVSWHTRLGAGDGVIYTETSAMGSYMVSTITIKDGRLFTEKGEQPYMESQLKMPLIGYSFGDRSALDQLRH